MFLSFASLASKAAAGVRRQSATEPSVACIHSLRRHFPMVCLCKPKTYIRRETLFFDTVKQSQFVCSEISIYVRRRSCDLTSYSSMCFSDVSAGAVRLSTKARMPRRQSNRWLTNTGK